jgi:hypothetical protein
VTPADRRPVLHRRCPASAAGAGGLRKRGELLRMRTIFRIGPPRGLLVGTSDFKPARREIFGRISAVFLNVSRRFLWWRRVEIGSRLVGWGPTPGTPGGSCASRYRSSDARSSAQSRRRVAALTLVGQRPGEYQQLDASISRERVRRRAISHAAPDPSSSIDAGSGVADVVSKW